MSEAVDLVLEFAGEKIGVAIHGGRNGDVDLSVYAPLDSPELAGEPTAPTPKTNDYGKRIATTQYVTEKLAEVVVEGGGMLPGVADPLAPGEATPGTSHLAARQDHVHPLQESVSGNAGSATKLQMLRTIALTGSVSGSASFDGSENITIVTVGNGTGGEPVGAVAWQDVQNKPSTFPPSTHSHTDYADQSHRHQAGEIDGLPSSVVLGTAPGLSATASGTAGTSEFAARNDHTHPLQTSVSGNAGSATKLLTARTITLSGAVSGNTSFDGSGNVTLTTTSNISGVQLGNTVGQAAGSASAGVASTAARSDHVHPPQTTVSGNAGSATKLLTARTITLSGAVSGSTSFDGSGNVTLTTTSNIVGLQLGNTVPLADGTASTGTAATAARSDHVHPKQASQDYWFGTAAELPDQRSDDVLYYVTG